MNAKTILAGILLFLLPHCPWAAGDAETVTSQLKGTVDQVLTVVADKSLDSKARRQRIRAACEIRFALPQMAGLVLGNHWRGLEPADKDAFVDVFTETLLDSYVRKIDTYNGETFDYGKVELAGKKGTVQATLKGTDRAIPVIYKVFASGDQWKIYDVEIDGVSVIKTYRSQYDEYLAGKTVADLIATMKDKLGD